MPNPAPCQIAKNPRFFLRKAIRRVFLVYKVASMSQRYKTFYCSSKEAGREDLLHSWSSSCRYKTYTLINSYQQGSTTRVSYRSDDSADDDSTERTSRSDTQSSARSPAAGKTDGD